MKYHFHSVSKSVSSDTNIETAAFWRILFEWYIKRGGGVEGREEREEKKEEEEF